MSKLYKFTQNMEDWVSHVKSIINPAGSIPQKSELAVIQLIASISEDMQEIEKLHRQQGHRVIDMHKKLAQLAQQLQPCGDHHSQEEAPSVDRKNPSTDPKKEGVETTTISETQKKKDTSEPSEDDQ